MAEPPGLVLQNGRDDPPARLGEWLAQRGLPHVVRRAWEDGVPAHAGDHAFIVALGSARSVNDTGIDWVAQELDLLRDAITEQVPVLGLCWGGQALAAALGGRVSRAPQAEVGWIAVRSDDPAIPAGPWMQYHYDVFTVPPGATELARSPAGPAAFAHGPHLGLQFHPEATPEMGVRWAREDRELTVSTPEAVAAQGARHGQAARALAFALFDAWARRAGVSAAVSAGTASTAPPRSPSG